MNQGLLEVHVLEDRRGSQTCFIRCGDRESKLLFRAQVETLEDKVVSLFDVVGILVLDGRNLRRCETTRVLLSATAERTEVKAITTLV